MSDMSSAWLIEDPRRPVSDKRFDRVVSTRMELAADPRRASASRFAFFFGCTELLSVPALAVRLAEPEPRGREGSASFLGSTFPYSS